MVILVIKESQLKVKEFGVERREKGR